MKEVAAEMRVNAPTDADILFIMQELDIDAAFIQWAADVMERGSQRVPIYNDIRL